MKRTIIKIDEELCNGCGNCVEGCHEGALQLIDGKAVMISDLYCDGLGACIGDCPVGAIELIEREAVPYNETAVMERIAPKGEKVILAHLKHLKDHNEMAWFNEAVEWCRKEGISLDLSKTGGNNKPEIKAKLACGCPGTTEQDFRQAEQQQWPVQLHLLNPSAGFLFKSDLLLASDCSSFSHRAFHDTFLKNKSLAIACPKLDSNIQNYVEKIALMIDGAQLNTITVLMMEVPCCSGLLQIAKNAREKAKRKIPVKALVISIRGEILSENWF